MTNLLIYQHIQRRELDLFIPLFYFLYFIYSCFFKKKKFFFWQGARVNYCVNAFTGLDAQWPRNQEETLQFLPHPFILQNGGLWHWSSSFWPVSRMPKSSKKASGRKGRQAAQQAGQAGELSGIPSPPSRHDSVFWSKVAQQFVWVRSPQIGVWVKQ